VQEKGVAAVSGPKREDPVRLTRIYTRGGDGGETSLGDGSRIAKADPLIAAIGAVDELNAALGLALAAELPAKVTAALAPIQNELFDLGADLSVPPGARPGLRLRVGGDRVEQLERLCDELNAALEPLGSFVLPGGNDGSARLHLARSICRRAELAVLAAAAVREQSPTVAVYLNRLSDLLFICARAAARSGEERLWRPGG
jgi:cob(I)alamin adenosyltransferase